MLDAAKCFMAIYKAEIHDDGETILSGELPVTEDFVWTDEALLVSMLDRAPSSQRPAILEVVYSGK